MFQTPPATADPSPRQSTPISSMWINSCAKCCPADAGSRVGRPGSCWLLCCGCGHWTPDASVVAVVVVSRRRALGTASPIDLRDSVAIELGTYLMKNPQLRRYRSMRRCSNQPSQSRRLAVRARVSRRRLLVGYVPWARFLGSIIDSIDEPTIELTDLSAAVDSGPRGHQRRFEAANKHARDFGNWFETPFQGARRQQLNRWAG